MTRSENALLVAISVAGLFVAAGICYLGDLVIEQKIEVTKIRMEMDRQERDLNRLRAVNGELRSAILRIRGDRVAVAGR